MNVNWKVRLRHPTFYLAVAALIGLILTDTGVIDIGRYEMYVQMLLAVLTASGVVVDLTTEGIGDSRQALTYNKPKPKKEDGNDFY